METMGTKVIDCNLCGIEVVMPNYPAINNALCDECLQYVHVEINKINEIESD